MLRAGEPAVSEHGSGASHQGKLRLRRVHPLTCATVNRKRAVRKADFVKSLQIKVVSRDITGLVFKKLKTGPFDFPGDHGLTTDMPAKKGGIYYE